MKLITKRDIILILLLLSISAAIFLGIKIVPKLLITDVDQVPVKLVEINVAGNILKQLDLNENQEFIIESKNHGTNHLTINDGQAYLTDASCPDKLCIHQGKIQEPGQFIACLPNAVIIKITTADLE